MYDENEIDDSVIVDNDMFDDFEVDDMYDDGDALASAGWGTDEDYGYYGSDDY